MELEEGTLFREMAAVAPQPVAIAAGAVLRARDDRERLDAIIRCGEVLTRYLAIVSLASYAARIEELPAGQQPLRLRGNLAFGHFLEVIRWVVALGVKHPLRDVLARAFSGRGEGAEGTCDVALTRLLQLRNVLGHQLDHLSEARARSTLATERPDRILAGALRSVERILSLQLMVVESQSIEDDGELVATLLPAMGENPDPYPWQVALEPGPTFSKNRCPYVALEEGALRLSPMMIWDVAEETRNYRLYFVDAIEPTRLRYKTVRVAPRADEDGRLEELRRVLAGERRAIENVRPKGARSFLERWFRERRKILANLRTEAGPVPWPSLSRRTLAWYAARVRGEGERTDPEQVIMQRLLDGRDLLDAGEIGQLVLLFGKEEEVRRRLGRPVLDLRAVGEQGSRWEERVECWGNIFDALELAIDFFVRHTALEGVTADDLSRSDGTADYVALREALVNILVHQDYRDKSAAAQVELRPDRAILFNPGRSLVGQAALAEGGKSQSRNPLVARALRLLGFAELAGSGLRVLAHAWREARRRPPRIESDKKANTFTLVLDWREIPVQYDEYWRRKLGVKVSPAEATLLTLATDPEGVGAQEAAAALAVRLEDATAMLERLKRQVLLEKRNGRWHIREDLRGLTGKTPREPG